MTRGLSRLNDQYDVTAEHAELAISGSRAPRRPIESALRHPTPRLSELVAHDDAALHDELHALQFGDVGERIAGDGDQVGELSLARSSRRGPPSRSSARQRRR